MHISPHYWITNPMWKEMKNSPGIIIIKYYAFLSEYEMRSERKMESRTPRTATAKWFLLTHAVFNAPIIRRQGRWTQSIPWLKIRAPILRHQLPGARLSNAPLSNVPLSKVRLSKAPLWTEYKIMILLKVVVYMLWTEVSFEQLYLIKGRARFIIVWSLSHYYMTLNETF